MEKINTYEQYAKALADFKGEGGRCSSNKMLTKDEITTLTEAGKLFYEITDDTFWLFEDDGYFYTGIFYVKKGSAISIKKQDKDVLTELMGNETRYDQQMEDELINAGFEKRDKYLEFFCNLNDVAEYTKQQLKIMRNMWEKQGFVCRHAVASDYPELCKLWEDKLDKNRYTLKSMTKDELEDMEKNKRCIIIVSPDGKICASSIYIRKNNTMHGFHTATYYLCLGAWVYFEKNLRAYEEGCVNYISWVRDDNIKSQQLSKNVVNTTGKFYRQFLLKNNEY